MLRVQVQMARPKLTYHRIGSIYILVFAFCFVVVVVFCCPK